MHSESYVSIETAYIVVEGDAVLVDDGWQKRRKTRESYVAAEKHALPCQVSMIQWVFSG